MANLNKKSNLLSKVPEVTIYFWIIKVLCTTVGETFADYLNFNLGFGLTNTTMIMGVVFFIFLFLQFRATKYVPAIYWLTVVFISVFGTLVTDNLTDGIGVPLEKSTTVFGILLGLTFLVWFASEKTLSIHSIYTRKREVFYWLTILFTFALGTAVGDLYSEQLGLGYFNTGITVVIIVAITYMAWKWLRLDTVLAFWVVYILTRPLGASLGDYLSQSHINGGLGLGTTITSVIFLAAILAVIVFLAVTKIDTASKSETVESGQAKKNKRNVLIQTVAVLCIFLAAGIGGYVQLNRQITSQIDSPVSATASNSDSSAASQAPASSPSGSSQTPAATPEAAKPVSQSKLAGRLTGFIKIENDMLNAINTKDYSSASKGADNLEHQWDIAEPKLRKIDGTAWTQIDGTIDVVLAAVRKSNPNPTKCISALNDSLHILNGSN
ncbi:hypothetical protein [Cohnella candidum]|uniref:COG4705 family protein n=1 Tax=Cohnella candidum TaxID=2674991 RepID=UPI001F154B7C|nr:hypothetical protein [Cohnella candidum]